MQYLKRKHFSYRIQFHIKKYDLFVKNLNKSDFSDFFVKTYSGHLSSFAYFSNLCQNFSKLSLSVLFKGFEIKSQGRRTHYLERPRNGGRIPAPIPDFPCPRPEFWGWGGDGDKAWKIFGDFLGMGISLILGFFEVVSPKFPKKISGVFWGWG